MMIAIVEFFIANIQILFEKIYKITLLDNIEKCSKSIHHHPHHHHYQKWMMTNHFHHHHHHLDQSILIINYHKRRRRRQQQSIIQQKIWQFFLLLTITMINYVNCQQTIQQQQAYHIPFVNNIQHQQQQQLQSFNIHQHHYPISSSSSSSSSYMAPSVAKIGMYYNYQFSIFDFRFD